MRNLPKKLCFIYIIENVTVSLLPYIPLSAWKEFHYFSCEASTCAKESVGIEKSSIFNFDRGHQSRIRGLLRVKCLFFQSLKKQCKQRTPCTNTGHSFIYRALNFVKFTIVCGWWCLKLLEASKSVDLKDRLDHITLQVKVIHTKYSKH